MKIAYLSNNDWFGTDSGLTFTISSSRGFLAGGADFWLILPARAAVDRDEAKAALGGDGRRLVDVRAPRIGGSRYLFYRSAYHRLAASDRQVLIFRAMNFMPWAVKLKRRGMRVYFESHDFWSDPALRDEPLKRSGRRYARLERRWLHQLDGVICQSSPQFALYRKHYPDLPVITAPTGCEPDPLPERRRFAHHLGFVGSCNLDKYPIDLVLRAISEVEDPPVRFLCVGARRDSQREALVSLARQLGVASRVEVHGWVTGSQLRQLTSRMDVGVACLADSFWNRTATPLKVVEYLAAGLPSVCSDLGGIRDLVRDGEQGILVENTVDAWAAGIRRIYADFPAYRGMVEACQRRARTMTWEQRARRLLEQLARREHAGAGATRCRGD